MGKRRTHRIHTTLIAAITAGGAVAASIGAPVGAGAASDASLTIDAERVVRIRTGEEGGDAV